MLCSFFPNVVGEVKGWYIERMGGTTIPEAAAGFGKEPAPSRWVGCLAGQTSARFVGSS